MRQDIELFEALYPILLSLTQLQELVDDTSVAVGSEAYAAGLMVYNYAKVSGALQNRNMNESDRYEMSKMFIRSYSQEWAAAW